MDMRTARQARGIRTGPGAQRPQRLVSAQGLRWGKSDGAQQRVVQQLAPEPTPMPKDTVGRELSAAMGGAVVSAALLMIAASRKQEAPEGSAASKLVQSVDGKVAAVEQKMLTAGLESPPPSSADGTPSNAEVRYQFVLWNQALATLSPEACADLYAPEAVVMPAVSSKVRTDRRGVVDFFVDFLKRRPQGEIVESRVAIMEQGLATLFGIYRLTLHEADGSIRTVPARFSFTYRREGDRWLIVSHHSTVLPDAPVQEEVRGMFSRYSAALASGDASAVAQLFSPEAVVLPAGSDVLRADPASILAYYEGLAPRRPRATMIESHVQKMGATTAAIHGICTLELDSADGRARETRVERWTFTFHKEAAGWSIVEHQASPLPVEDAAAVLASMQSLALPPPSHSPLDLGTAPTAAPVVAVPVGPSSPAQASSAASAGPQEVIDVEAGAPAAGEEDEVRRLVEQWNSALATLSPEAVADLYAPDAMLMPADTFTVRGDRAGIVTYYTDFLQRQPFCVVTSSKVTLQPGQGMASHTGAATFTFTERDGSTTTTPMRFSFTYRRLDGRWLIQQHLCSTIADEGSQEDALLGAGATTTAAAHSTNGNGNGNGHHSGATAARAPVAVGVAAGGAKDDDQWTW